jgi:hypothetical protein
MARSVFVVNDGLREKVRHLAGLGVPQDDIAKIIGCTAKTLRKRFRDDLRLSVRGGEGRQYHGDDLLAEDQGALAGAGGGERPERERRRRVEFGYGLGHAR